MRPSVTSIAVDHREGEGFDPVAIHRKVAQLDLVKVGVDVGLRDVPMYQLSELFLGQYETGLVLPQRVVAVEPHDRDRHEAIIREEQNSLVFG